MSAQKLYRSQTGPDFLATNWGRPRTSRAKYRFSVDGGAVSTITPAINEIIPDNAIITGVTINSTVAVTSGGSATISVGTSAGSAADALKAATGKASFSLDAVINGAATFAAPVKMTAAGLITLSIAVAALTAGEIEVVAHWHLASA